jgi:hypothetical protein
MYIVQVHYARPPWPKSFRNWELTAQGPMYDCLVAHPRDPHRRASPNLSTPGRQRMTKVRGKSGRKPVQSSKAQFPDSLFQIHGHIRTVSCTLCKYLIDKTKSIVQE